MFINMEEDEFDVGAFLRDGPNGHQYTETSTLDSDVKDIQEGGYEMKYFLQTLEDCSDYAKSTLRYARIYKFLNVLATMIFIILNAVITVLAIESGTWYLAAISFTVTVTQLSHELFGLGKKGVYFKSASIRYTSIRRTLLDELMNAEDDSQLENIARILRKEMDDLDVTLFNMSYGPRKIYASGGNVEADTDPFTSDEIEV